MLRRTIALFQASVLMTASAFAAERQVNVAAPLWGTRIESSSAFSSAHSAWNLADGSAQRGHGWLSADSAPLPQIVSFTFAEPFRLTLVRVRQAEWGGTMYQTKQFRVETSADGRSFQPAATGTLADRAAAVCEHALPGQEVLAVRIVVLSSYNPVQTCGLGEVELIASLPEDRRPPFGGASPSLDWRTFRGTFRLHFDLEPAVPLWYSRAGTGQRPPCGDYHGGPYRLTVEEADAGPQRKVLKWRISRTDAKPFKLRSYQLDCRTSYSGVYKMFHPTSFSQQNYAIDLPFNTRGASGAENQSPLVWMQQTDGGNTLTVGLLDQLRKTEVQGWTYNPGNGGEAPGIANSYVRAEFTRAWSAEPPITVASDGIYINADGSMSWHQALADYSRAVDAARNFRAEREIPDSFLNPMWHSWYAHSDRIDEKQIRDDARRAAALGVTTMELDAGWNVPPGIDYSLEVDGDYRFDPQRFPTAKKMIDQMHAAGQRVILHVSPLVMGRRCHNYAAGMKACVTKVKGQETNYLDPRLAKTHEFLLAAWEGMFRDYDIDGLWYDFLEVAGGIDPPPAGMAVVCPDSDEAYTLLLERLAAQVRRQKKDAPIVMRRGSANHNAKRFCTHVWPMDTPQDYNMNRRDVVYLKTLGPGVLTHACCTSWAISESDVNVSRQMASVVLAGVPAFSVKLAESPGTHNDIIRNWLAFYEKHKRPLVLGEMTPLLPTPASAALRIEAPDEAFFGLFEAVPGVLPLTRAVRRVTIVNAFSNRLAGRLEGVDGTWRVETFDHRWRPIRSHTLKSEEGGLALRERSDEACFSVVLTRE